MTGVTQAKECRCCGGTRLADVLDLGMQPLANSYTQQPEVLPVYPLVLRACVDCGHSQLSIFVPPDLMFRHYLYVSGTSPTFRAHFAGLAAEALDWVASVPAPRILDLACNDGTLLEAFRRQGCQVQGVDPAANLVALSRGKGLTVTEGYWPAVQPEVAGPFDLVTATNVLAHVADPVAFLDAALGVLAPGGLVILEVPYARAMLSHGVWDPIYHEHLSYFLMAPLLRLVTRAGGQVAHVRQVPAHGGSLRVAIRRGSGEHCAEARRLAEAEEAEGLLKLAAYHRLAQHVEQVCAGLASLAHDLVRDGYRLIGYGASAKGNTLLNRCPVPLAYIVDDNPLKHGYYTPGRQIPIHPPAMVLTEPPALAVLLLAWNFARDIQANWKVWRPTSGDCFVHYVPQVACHAAAAPLPLPEGAVLR